MNHCLLWLTRSAAGGLLFRFWLRFAPATFPVRRLLRDRSLLAFRHPAPSYPVHILLIPLPPRLGLESLSETDEGLFLAVYRAALAIAADRNLPPGWRLAVNAGRFQEVRVLHFHLIY